jgi:glutamate carboxypeptidase
MERLAALRACRSDMTTALAQLVEAESPSNEPLALAACADVVVAIGAELLGAMPERIMTPNSTHLLWRFGPRTEIVLLGHLDTVWPLGTLAAWPFSVDGDVATGPGSFDMKAGLVQGLYALSMANDRQGVAFLVTGDEEIGSPSSRALIEEVAAGAVAALVLEPSAGGALKTARKGVSTYRIDVEGRAAHAGLEPENGANALVELAHQVLALGALARPDRGTTVTPTVAAAGTTTNTVPASARVDIDVRVADPAEQARVDRAMGALSPVVAGTRLTVSGGPNRPPLPASASADLAARARSLAEQLGLGPLSTCEVGGGSDGNFTAAIGVPTLDGLGAVGDGAHARGEHVLLSAMAERAALVAALLDDLRAPFIGENGLSR